MCHKNMVNSQEKRGAEKVRGKYPPKGKKNLCEGMNNNKYKNIIYQQKRYPDVVSCRILFAHSCISTVSWIESHIEQPHK